MTAAGKDHSDPSAVSVLGNSGLAETKRGMEVESLLLLFL